MENRDITYRIDEILHLIYDYDTIDEDSYEGSRIKVTKEMLLQDIKSSLNRLVADVSEDAYGEGFDEARSQF